MTPSMEPASRLPVLVIAGPTASGKSALAIDVAEAFGGVVINADSMQIYRELSVLTARPDGDEMARVPHRLYGMMTAAQACSVGTWLALAKAEIESARTLGELPIVVGGTGLYLKALLEGLAEVPPIPDGVRAETRALFDELGAEEFLDRLRKLDPESAARLLPNDRQRLVRAYEVVTATGRSLPDWLRDQPAEPGVEGPFATIALLPDRQALYAATDARFARMVEEGAIDEVAVLLRLGLDGGVPALKAVGVRELAQYVRGEATLAEAVERGRKATRNYAKRQLTWLRHQIVPDLVIPTQYSESVRERIFNFIRHSVLTAAI